MNKLNFYLWNACYSSLIGAAVFVVGLAVGIYFNSFHKVWDYLLHYPVQMLSALLFNLLFCMGVGAVIGTVSLFCVFQIFLAFTQRPWLGLTTNFLVVALLNIVGAIATGIRSYQQFAESLWFWALPVSEVLSFFLASLWYKRMMLYKAKLEQKKAELHQQDNV